MKTVIENIKNIIKQVLNYPVHFFIVLGLFVLMTLALEIQGRLDLIAILIMSVLAGMYILYYHLGSIVSKAGASFLLILYLVSTYSGFVASEHQLIVQPFFLTIASMTAFLGQTYSSKNHALSLRSRPLWSSVLALILVLTKSSLILSKYSYVTTELVGLLILIVFTVLWRTWLAKSKKTKINNPVIIDVEELDKFRRINIYNRLDAINKVWLKDFTEEKENAYPYIYNEVLKADEDGKMLMIVSKNTSNSIYDLGEIEINRSKTIPYLYMETEDDKDTEWIIEDFIDEVRKGYTYLNNK